VRQPLVGVLALQGGFALHGAMLAGLGAEVREVRTSGGLQGLDGLVIPGGESTTMTLGVEREGMAPALAALVAAGTPVLGTCAGLIMLDRDHLGLMDIRAERNAFGRQVRSFEADVSMPVLGEKPIRAVFIRAPWISDAGPGVERLAEVDGRLVAARERHLLVAAFHPELGDDSRLHALFLEGVRGGVAGG
jgi:5'-phosphate synthase pdxT subunit